MPHQPSDSPLGAFLKALREENIDVPVKVLPLSRVIASKRAANREKDVAVLPILRRTLRLAKRLETRRAPIGKPGKRRKQRRRKNKLP